jgi:hypothetical protein
MPFTKIYFKGSAYMVDPTVAETICNLQSVADALYDNASSDADYQEVYEIEDTIEAVLTDAIFALNAYEVNERKVA